MTPSVFAFFCLWTRFFIRDNNDDSSTGGNSYLIWLPVLGLDHPAVCSVSEKGISKKYFMHETSVIPSLHESHSWSYCREQPLSLADSSSSSIFFSGLFGLLDLRSYQIGDCEASSSLLSAVFKNERETWVFEKQSRRWVLVGSSCCTFVAEHDIHLSGILMKWRVR